MTTGRINQVAAILRTPPAAPSRKRPTPAKGIRRPKPHDWMSVVLAWKGIHLRAGLLCPHKGEPQPAPLSVFARLSIQPRRRRRCGTQARFVDKGAGVPVGGPVALAADRAEQAPPFQEVLFRRSRRPSRASLGFQSGLHIVYRHKLPAPRSRTAPLESSRTKRPQVIPIGARTAKH